MGHPYRERHTIASTTTKDLAGTQATSQEQAPTPKQSETQAKKGRKKAT